MKTFMAVYVGSPDTAAAKAWNALKESERQEKEKVGMNAWIDWGKKNAASVKDHGAPLGKTLRVDGNGVSASRNNLSGYIIVEAESHEEAARKFLDHPHFKIFPGDAVEIMECMPMPVDGM